MSDEYVLDVQMRIKALELAAEGVDGGTPIDVIIEIAALYYDFLSGATDE